MAALTAFLFLALPARGLPAQESPAVRAAVRLAAEGRGDSARTLVNTEMARHRPGDAAYVEALFWRARLAVRGDSAERDLRRVAIEFPMSAWADDALLQLSQLALAAGNPAGSYDLARRIRSDHPGSDLRARAALWAGRAAFEVGEPRAACALLDSARAESAQDVEFVNQVDFFRARCSGVVAAAQPGRPVEPADTARAAAPAAGFEVQVAATRSADAARSVADRLTRAGHRPRVLVGADGLRRVRLGPYNSQAEADSAVAAARRVVGGSPFVVRLP